MTDAADLRRRMMRDAAEARSASLLEPTKAARLRLATDDPRRGLLAEVVVTAAVCLAAVAVLTAFVLWIGGAL